MGYFSRVKKIEVKGKEEKEAEVTVTKKGGNKKKEAGNMSPRARDSDRDEDGKKKRKKFRLQPHEHQKFFDSSEDVRCLYTFLGFIFISFFPKLRDVHTCMLLYTVKIVV